MRFVLSLLLTLWALPAVAQCVGENLLQTMAAEKRAKLEAAIAAHPFDPDLPPAQRAVTDEQPEVLLQSRGAYTRHGASPAHPNQHRDRRRMDHRRRQISSASKPIHDTLRTSRCHQP